MSGSPMLPASVNQQYDQLLLLSSLHVVHLLSAVFCAGCLQLAALAASQGKPAATAASLKPWLLQKGMHVVWWKLCLHCPNLSGQLSCLAGLLKAWLQCPSLKAWCTPGSLSGQLNCLAGLAARGRSCLAWLPGGRCVDKLLFCHGFGMAFASHQAAWLAVLVLSAYCNVWVSGSL